MKLKHLLIILLLLFIVIYYDIIWYNYAVLCKQNNPIIIWWTINCLIMGPLLIFLICKSIEFLHDDTYFFESISKLLNKRLL